VAPQKPPALLLTGAYFAEMCETYAPVEAVPAVAPQKPAVGPALLLSDAYFAELFDEYAPVEASQHPTRTGVPARTTRYRARCLLSAYHTDPLKCGAQQYCDSPSEITAEWPSAALDAQATSFSISFCDQGQTALTALVRDIAYGAGVAGRPKSVALKMHHQAEIVRQTVAASGGCSKESFFYTALADEVPPRSSKVFGAWNDGADITSNSPPYAERFNLMMEDMSADL